MRGALVKSRSNLSKIGDELRANADCFRPGDDGRKACSKKGVHFDLRTFNTSVDRSEAMTAWPLPGLYIFLPQTLANTLSQSSAPLPAEL